ncbi:MAG: protein-(glutamine-N5) methyltransferase, release factor-specific, partial [Spirochaetia bacterium]|nr:protein-(glutamine-N5) methyltransferase, release factor-specific [Spirochaetia bacterium]
MTIQQFKSQAIKSLENGKIPSPSAGLDVSILLEHCLKQNKTWILLHSSEELNTEQFAWLTEAVAARSTGLPV